jgi:hypothetical protein
MHIPYTTKKKLRKMKKSMYIRPKTKFYKVRIFIPIRRRIDFASGLFPSGLPTKNLMYLSLHKTANTNIASYNSVFMPLVYHIQHNISWPNKHNSVQADRAPFFVHVTSREKNKTPDINLVGFRPEFRHYT